ncbi:membrane protein DedA with SNARE-associated domain [Thiogranum longum]|uniref:Membrane protein DedA with SNARE-associated domain n=1 Tax=Thiogranum longum TaxID=1537524 RepID=A0A4R1HIF5_9GAMM|nr:DedA family protein [Thiogranum longum]TCK19209.1 membrane protein DedA with SNARE-associated domain [Thiogranum longum]
MNAFVDSFVNWLTNSPWPCPTIAFLIFLESSPVIGLLLPGVILVPVIGSLSGHGLIDFWQVLFCAMTGAVLTDSIGYWLGRLGYTEWQHKLGWSGSRDLQNRAKTLFKHYGPVALFVGRIMFVIHPMVPITAGVLGVRLFTFYLIDTAAIFIWLLLYLSGGHWLTILWYNLNSEQRIWLSAGFALLAMLLILWRGRKHHHV